MTEHLPECPVWRCCKPDERATVHMCICPDDERIGGLITRQIAEKIGRNIGQYGCVIPEQQHLPECPCEPCICSYLRACEERVRSNRLVEAIFHAPHSGARAFVLQRITDASGVSGTGIVAHGAEFPDGCVALRWVGSNPTSVVFHDNGISSVQAIHGHGGNTQIVWTSEDMGERAAEMDECQRRGYAAALDAALEAVSGINGKWVFGPRIYKHEVLTAIRLIKGDQP